MSHTTQNNTQQSRIQIDASQFSKAAQQLYSVPTSNTGFGVRKKLSTSPDLVPQTLIKYLQGSYAAELVLKRSSDTDVDTSSLFVDTRKQEPFDWVKTTNAYQRIIHLLDLEDRWDGYDALKFSKSHVERALTFYSSLRTYSINRRLNFQKIEPFVAPSSDGSILFEWAGKRFPIRQLEVYVPREEHHLFEYLKTEGESEEEGELHLDGLYLILDWLFKI